MVLNGTQCDASHKKVLSKVKKGEFILRRFAPDYAADLSVPILDCGKSAIEKEIDSSTMFVYHASTTVKLLSYKIGSLLKGLIG